MDVEREEEASIQQLCRSNGGSDTIQIDGNMGQWKRTTDPIHDWNIYRPKTFACQIWFRSSQPRGKNLMPVMQTDDGARELMMILNEDDTSWWWWSLRRRRKMMMMIMYFTTGKRHHINLFSHSSDITKNFSHIQIASITERMQTAHQCRAFT